MAQTMRFGRHFFDIDLIEKHIAAGDVPFVFEPKANIVGWAQGILGLRKGDPTHRPTSFLFRVDYNHVDTLTKEDLKKPIYMVELNEGWIVADGSHRITKAFWEGDEHLPAYYFNKKAAKKLQGPVMPKKAKKVKVGVTNAETRKET